ncbi:MAG: pilus assembly protein PilM [Bdellovibrionales bacterium]|jgi:general secretion pathway protein L|nr:pilus assembly protein PilM [Bdellovibrionales bacterium]
MKTLGIDIGSSSIKIAEVEGSGRSVSINQVWELPLSTDPSRDQAIEVIEKLRGFAGQYVSQFPSKDIQWVVGVPQRSVSTRFRRFPFIERSKVLKSLPFELEEDIPFDASSTIYDARVLRTFLNGSDVLAVASPHEAIEKTIARAKDGGFEANIVSCEGFALSNILDTWSQPPPHVPEKTSLGEDAARSQEIKTAHAILQIGHRYSNLVVYADSTVVAIRSIQWGGHDVALAIEKTFQVPYVEAIKVLKTKSFVLLNTTGASRDQLAMHKTISDSATPLIQDLRTTLLDLRASVGADIRDLRLTGGASQIQNLSPWLTQALEVSVNPLEYFGALASQARMQIRIPLTPETENMAATAIGLALEGIRKPRNPAINFRKGLFAQANESMKVFWETWRNTLQIAVAIFVVFCAYAIARDSQSLTLATNSDETLSQAARTAANLRGSQATPDGIRRYIQTEERAIKNRETLAQLDSYIQSLDFVLKLSERLPVQLPPRAGRGLDVDRLKIENDDLTIEGRTQGADILASVEKELQLIARPGTLKKVAPSSLRTGAPGTSFGFSMKIDRKP